MRGTDADALSASYAEGRRDERARRDDMTSDQQALAYEFAKWKRDQGAAWQEQIEDAERRAEKAEALAKYNGDVLDASSKQLLAEIQLRTKAEAREAALREACNAYKDLLACYRLGTSPTSKLFDALEKADAALAVKERSTP